MKSAFQRCSHDPVLEMLTSDTKYVKVLSKTQSALGETRILQTDMV